MSAYVVSNETINCIVNGAIKYWEYKRLSAEQIGQMLFEENARSVNYRYAENEAAPTFEFTEKEYTDEQIIGCIFCWEYQSCETDDFATTSAFELVRDIKNSMLREMHPNRPWGLD